MVLSAGCSSTQYITPDYILQDAHVGGSLLRAARFRLILASGGWSGIVKLWDLKNGELLLTTRSHSGNITGLRFIRQDQAFISAGYDGKVVITDINGLMLRQVKVKDPITAMTLDEPGDLLITGHKSGAINLWSIEQLQAIKSLHFHTSRITALAYDPRQSLLASVDSDSLLSLWRHRSDLQHRIKLGKTIRTLAFNPSGSALYGGSWFELYRWQMPDMHQENINTDHAGMIASIKFNHEGDSLYSISRDTDSSVLLLNPLDGNLQKRFYRHSLCGSSLELSANDRYLISSSDDGSINIWDLQADASAASEK